MGANADIMQALRDMPRRDNTAYHRFVNEARQAFTVAERQLSGPVDASAEYHSTDDAVIVTFVFTKQGQGAED